MTTTPAQGAGATAPPAFDEPQDRSPDRVTAAGGSGQDTGEGSAKEQAAHAAGTAASEAKGVAGTAASEAKSVAGTAASEARDVAGEAKAHVRDLAAEARTQIDEQSRTQRDRLAHALEEAADELRSMVDAGGGDGVATELVRQAATRAGGLAAFLGRHEPAELVTEVRRFARRRPGTFLLGAVAAGVLAGRTVKGMSEDGTPKTSGAQADASVAVTGTGPAAPATAAAPGHAATAQLAPTAPPVADPTMPSRDPNLGPTPLGTGYGGPPSPGGRP